MAGAIAVAKSANSKIGPVSATSVAQQSCPTTCPFMGSGCYAESGMQAFTTRRLNKSSASPLDLAYEEADAIRAIRRDTPLRLHVVGDSTSDAAARIVSGAADERDGKAWTYTHAWRTVARESWGNVSVLASCETEEDIRDARARGYATAIVVDQHDATKRYERDGESILPCPQQTRDNVTCDSCRLCWDDSRLRDAGLTIGFAVHGSGAKKAKGKLG
jgi:hypothetical protein